MGEQPQSRLGSTTGGSSPERRRHGKVWKGGPVMGAGDVVARGGVWVVVYEPSEVDHQGGSEEKAKPVMEGAIRWRGRRKGMARAAFLRRTVTAPLPL